MKTATVKTRTVEGIACEVLIVRNPRPLGIMDDFKVLATLPLETSKKKVKQIAEILGYEVK